MLLLGLELNSGIGMSFKMTTYALASMLKHYTACGELGM